MTAGSRLKAAALAPLRWLAHALDPLFRVWQRATGHGGMIALFLLPNMAIFGVFVLVEVHDGHIRALAGKQHRHRPAYP